jgi:hypothetical protein
MASTVDLAQHPDCGQLDLATLVSEANTIALAPGDLYLESLSVAARRKTGQVYTPPGLVDFILDQAGYTAEQPIERARLLDPACGAGVFLQGAVLRLVQRLLAEGIPLSSPAGRLHILKTIETRIYGVDVDSKACSLARAAVRTLVAHILGERLPRSFFVTNVVHADYLASPLSSRLASKLGTDFNYIVGNPPYVSTGRLSSKYKRQLRRTFVTAKGRFDLYTLFMERSVSLLADTGKLAFITPNKFLISVTSAPLRALLLHSGAVRKIANFRSHQVFEDVAMVPCVLTFEKGTKADNVDISECDAGDSLSRRPTVLKTSAIAATRLHAGPWDLNSGEMWDLVEKIRTPHPTLRQFASRISAGLATGLDEVFVVSRRDGANLERSLVRPAIRGRDLFRYRLSDPELEVIIPYQYDSSGKSRLVRLRDYPRINAYLLRHRDRLEKRHCYRVWGKAWYDIHDPVAYDIARTPKILVPDVANSNRFVFDPGTYCPLHSAYYIVPNGIEPYYLTAILNSRPVEFLMRLLAPVVKDGFSRYRKQFLMPLPIPAASPADVVAISDAARKGDAIVADALVCALFGLSHQDVKLVDEFLDVTRQ